jgi:hypothetical protein
LEDKDKVFENGPYLFESVGLYLRLWSEKFNPKKEYIMVSSVWIKLYSLLNEFWNEKMLKGIGNALRSFFEISKVTKKKDTPHISESGYT